jgi:hypothetical protein
MADVQLVWDDAWEAPPTPPARRHRPIPTAESVTLHTSTDAAGLPVRLDVLAFPSTPSTPAAVETVLTVGRGTAVYDSATRAGREALTDLIAALTAALTAGQPCEGCGAAAAIECGPDCLSHVTDADGQPVDRSA